MRALPEILPIESSGLSECFDRLAAHKWEMRPLSTYRLQFHKGFRFSHARELVPYLHELGISHIYSSPILKALAGSTHGYDIADHNQLNPELGGEEEFRAFVDELRHFRIGQLLDLVPNHMGVCRGENPWWQDVLENGRCAEHSDFFDIDWQPLKAELRGKLLLPILANQYGQELEDGRMRLAFDEQLGRFQVRYYETTLPVDPQTVPQVFMPALEDAGQESPEPLIPLRRLLSELAALPLHTETAPERGALRRELAPALLDGLASILHSSPTYRNLLERALARINGKPNDPASFDSLHRLLEAQVYRLAHWRVSAEEINYRRFFDINDLVGLRMENPRVFAATHRLVRRLLAEGSVNGLRIDHCDGLLNPRQYLVRVQMLYAASQCSGRQPVPPLAENGIEVAVQNTFSQHDWMHQHAPLYCVVEKILEPGEELPTEWPVDGTSGYDFVNQVNGIFIQKQNERAFTTIYDRFIGEHHDFETLLYSSKKLIMNTALSSEVNVLAHMLDEMSSTNRRARDFTRKALRDAIRETIAGFAVYRAYIDERGEITERCRQYIHHAIALAKRRNAGTPSAVFDFLRDILLLEHGNSNGLDPEHSRKLHFSLKFQQLTGPVMAKGLEDTVCYVYNRFISVNEVGSSPKLFGHSLEHFHRANLHRAEHWPFSILATSTHDTKRSEDVRARLNVLSEMPRLWSAEVMRWRRLNKSKKRTLADGIQAPDANEEYLLYQTLVGAWPLLMNSQGQRDDFTERITQYMIKALHEAKVNLSWINPNPEYVAAVKGFIQAILAPDSRGVRNLFLRQLESFLPAVQFFGALNSLAQTVLKITSPGVPDMYQGTELWDFSLVDPDNRRPVDFALRREMARGLADDLARDRKTLCSELLANYKDGRLKLFTTMRCLNLRRDHPELFRTGPYLPMESSGEKRDHVCSFARESSDPFHGKGTAIIAVPRFSYTLMKGRVGSPIGELWSDTELHVPPNAPGQFENIFTGKFIQVTARRTLQCSEVFRDFPVAVLAGR